MIDWTKPVETDEDTPRPVRVLCTDLDRSAYDIAIAIPVSYPSELMSNPTYVYSCSANGYVHNEEFKVRNVRPKPIKRNVVVKLRQNRHGKLIADVYEIGEDSAVVGNVGLEYIAETLVCVETVLPEGD